MKPKTMAYMLAGIVVAYLIYGASIVSDIQTVNEAIQNKSLVMEAAIEALPHKLDKLNHFLCVFSALVCVIFHPLLIPKKPTKQKMQVKRVLDKCI